MRSLSKKQFLHLIENILSDANIKLDQQEDDSLKNIEERLSKPRTNVNAEERGIVDNIIKKYKYQFDEETLWETLIDYWESSTESAIFRSFLKT